MLRTGLSFQPISRMRSIRCASRDGYRRFLLAARQSHLTTLGKFLKSVKERALHLDEDVEVNDAQDVHPYDCFVIEVQHHHRSQLLAVVMEQCLRDAMVWIGEVEDAESIDELITSASMKGEPILHFENLDFKTASGLKNILTGNSLKKSPPQEAKLNRRRDRSLADRLLG